MIDIRKFADWLDEIRIVTEIATCYYCPVNECCNEELDDIDCVDAILQYLGDTKN